MTMQFAAVLAAVSSLALAGAAQAATTHLMANMSGAKEKPTAGDAKATGMAHLTVDTDKNQVCYELTTQNLAQPIMAHIHKGGPDAAGPVAVPLTPPDANGHSQGCASADAAVVKDIADNPGNYYVNVHSTAFKAGAIRGQLGK
ncbi:MAG TPA: CHRD domain-containing protein [Phenylobacterium sp.]|uniref:CHRD domain-containing protein n=1 Tax=Phenylobacterium sp. TaxID=1871053 RepID=UPI002CE5F62D|nr:CHRD domain-containing protein [Phenylobacterium sp.]HSV03729.1 CHRD domain-containing protein [Phenylobacterium sp.]